MHLKCLQTSGVRRQEVLKPRLQLLLVLLVVLIDVHVLIPHMDPFIEGFSGALALSVSSWGIVLACKKGSAAFTPAS